MLQRQYGIGPAEFLSMDLAVREFWVERLRIEMERRSEMME